MLKVFCKLCNEKGYHYFTIEGHRKQIQGFGYNFCKYKGVFRPKMVGGRILIGGKMGEGLAEVFSQWKCLSFL